ncbi:MAG: HAD family phosphatase [Oscillospiraceae bacterium]|nr:HAD family phosphatase [Oscillospiraceae bacterium]
MKAFIFDMDGVIFDSERLYIDCCIEVADKLGMDHIVETCHRCIGVTTEVTRAILLETYRDEELVDRFREQSVDLVRSKIESGLLKMKPGVRELLDCLRERGCLIAVASSTQTDIVEKELTDAGLRDCFTVVVGGDQAQRSKPNPDIFLKAAELLGEMPENCVVIEDSFNGIRAAKAAGMTAIMVPDQLVPDEEISKLADFVLPSLVVVKDRLESLK